jgi:hypothetical protein
MGPFCLRLMPLSQAVAVKAVNSPPVSLLLTMKTPDPGQFRSGRQFAAWIGLTPKDHSTAGKVRLGVITRAGDEGLRSVLVVGATAAIQQALRGGQASPWLAALLKRKSPKLAAVALANKTARVAWKMMPTGEAYSAKWGPPSWQAYVAPWPDYGNHRPARLLSYGSASTVFRYVTLYGPHHTAGATFSHPGTA